MSKSSRTHDRLVGDVLPRPTEGLRNGPILRHQIREARAQGLKMQLHLNQFSGQREKNKVEKLQRIRQAAWELFVRKGFDETTTREIAIRAGVGIGTVFTYAENKRDLLFLVANDDLDEVTRKAEASISEDASCLENFLTVFRHHYQILRKAANSLAISAARNDILRLGKAGEPFPEDARTQHSADRQHREVGGSP